MVGAVNTMAWGIFCALREDSSFPCGLEKHALINSTILFTRDITQFLAGGYFPPAVSISGLEMDTQRCFQSYYSYLSDSSLFYVSQSERTLSECLFTISKTFWDKNTALLNRTTGLSQVGMATLCLDSSSGLSTWQCTENQTEKSEPHALQYPLNKQCW